MGVLSVEGNITAGPQAGATTFPTAQLIANLGTSQQPKAFQAATGTVQRTLSNPGPAFVTLGEPGQSVQNANFFYFRCNGQITLELTTDDGSGGNVVSVVPVLGLLIMEFPDTNFLKNVSYIGTAQAEFFLSGNQ